MNFIQIRNACHVAVMHSMTVVRAYQLGLKTSQQSEYKTADDTLVTVTDRESEAAAVPAFENLPDVEILAEEHVADAGKSTASTLVLYDPLDGTRAFTNGLATSTVIAAAYDKASRRVQHCTIGEPATGRIWSADPYGCALEIPGVRPSEAIHVWKGPLDSQATVLIDLSCGFVSRGRRILTDVQAAHLFRNVASVAKVLMPGSNGLHQALVANGGEKLAASITTAIGGPWDVCGALLVFQAGGSARAFRLENGELQEKDPLDVLDYDILVAGNNSATVDALVELLACALKGETP